MVNQSCMSKGLFKQGQTSQRQLHRCKAQPSIGKDSLKLHPWSALTCRQLPKLSILPQQFLLILWPPRERSFVNLSSSRDFQRLELLTSWVLKGAPSGMEVFPFGKYCWMTGNGSDQQHLLWVAYAPSFSQLPFGWWLQFASSSMLWTLIWPPHHVLPSMGSRIFSHPFQKSGIHLQPSKVSWPLSKQYDCLFSDLWSVLNTADGDVGFDFCLCLFICLLWFLLLKFSVTFFYSFFFCCCCCCLHPSHSGF